MADAAKKLDDDIGQAPTGPCRHGGGRPATGTVVTLKDGRHQGIITLSSGKRKRLPAFEHGTPKEVAEERTKHWSGKWRGLPASTLRSAGKSRWSQCVPPNHGGVYLVADGRGRVKIGRAQNVARRMRELQCACPDPLVFLGMLSLKQSDERRFHKLFRRFRLRGEWFIKTQEMAAYVLPADATPATEEASNV